MNKIFNIYQVIELINKKTQTAVSALLTQIDLINLPSTNIKAPLILKKSNPIKSIKINSSSSNSQEQETNIKVLNKRKKQLLDQLRTVDQQIRRISNQKSSPKNRWTEPDNPELFEKANEFILKMNQQRKELQRIKNKKYQALNISVQKSLKEFKTFNQEKQHQLEIKRKMIQQRIESRHKQTIQKLKINKHTNNLIQQIQSYKLSIPIINDQALKLPQTFKRDVKSQANKNYPKSIFLENVQKQDLIKKREQYLKNAQRKNIKERQAQYARMIRKKYRKSDDGLFLT